MFEAGNRFKKEVRGKNLNFLTGRVSGEAAGAGEVVTLQGVATKACPGTKIIYARRMVSSSLFQNLQALPRLPGKTLGSQELERTSTGDSR